MRITTITLSPLITLFVKKYFSWIFYIKASYYGQERFKNWRVKKIFAWRTSWPSSVVDYQLHLYLSMCLLNPNLKLEIMQHIEAEIMHLIKHELIECANSVFYI